MGADPVADRQAIVDVVIRYATGIDTRDWALFRSCFTDPCEIDCSSWSGRPAGEMPADAWVQQVRGTNGHFETTQHLSTNHVVTFGSADDATCVSSMHAQHWYSAERLAALGQPGDGPRWCTLGGYDTNQLVRTDDWKIRRCQLTVTLTTGDPAVFEIARAMGDRG